MGLYTDITTDIAGAFDSDLSDAVETLTITEFGAASYNPVTGTSTPTETNYTTRGVVTRFINGEIIDEVTLTDSVQILILDSEKSVSKFELGMKVLIGTETQPYKISGVSRDPAKITYTLQCRRWA